MSSLPSHLSLSNLFWVHVTSNRRQDMFKSHLLTYWLLLAYSSTLYIFWATTSLGLLQQWPSDTEEHGFITAAHQSWNHRSEIRPFWTVTTIGKSCSLSGINVRLRGVGAVWLRTTWAKLCGMFRSTQLAVCALCCARAVCFKSLHQHWSFPSSWRVSGNAS